MFNLLVAGNGERWEGERLSITASRFKEYSGAEADTVSLDRPDSLRQLEEIPSLLMYEVGATGPNPRLVRHGRLRDIALEGRDLTFFFEPDPQRAYLSRGVILEYSALLGMHRFEQHRTHWAIKDGDLPAGLLDAAVPERPERTVSVVAAEYVSAVQRGLRHEHGELEAELRAFPPSLEKAQALLQSRITNHPTPEIYPLLGVKEKTPEARSAVVAVIARDVAGENLPPDWPYSLAWFLDQFGSPTENALREQAIEACAQHLIGLGAEGGGVPTPVEDIAGALWRCARSPLLVRRLHREIAVLVSRLALRQTVDGYWNGHQPENNGLLQTVRGTALATVALQRLGDDQHHDAIERAVHWLIQCRLTNGALPRWAGVDAADPLATVVAMEALRRSNIGADVPHVIAEAEAWLVSGQTAFGGWLAEPWPEDFVVATVLEYFERRGAMLPQADGFLLMARDFFRKAEKLRAEGGANNRRLAAIATVHAVEMFLYGLFEEREDLALSAFRENGVETLGPREALRALQESLQRLGVISQQQRLRYRDPLSSLIGKRDGIIHRAHEISSTELESGMGHARKFIDKYGADLLGRDILQ